MSRNPPAQATPPDLAELARATPEQRLLVLATSDAGLTADEAAARLRQYGANSPAQDTRSGPLSIFIVQFTHTLALLLWFAAGLAFAAGIPELGGAIVAVVAINGVFAFVQEYRAGQVVESLMRGVAVKARAVRDGELQTVEASALVPGDIVHLGAGDIVPADCVLIRSANLAVDLSMLTGETYAVGRSEMPVELSGGEAQLIDAACMVPAGCGVVTGTATAAVWATGPESSVGEIARLIETAGGEESILEHQVEALSRTTAVIAVTAGAATLTLAALFQQTSFFDALTFGTGVIVALVPEGLLPTLSVALAIGAQRIARRGAAVRQLSAVEVIGSVTVICTDKTGTLTENSLTVERFVAPDGSVTPGREVLLAAVLCNEATQNGSSVRGDPLDVALWRWVSDNGLDVAHERAVHPAGTLVPFDAHRRLMSVTCNVDGAPVRFVKGAPEAVMPLTSAQDMPGPLVEAVEEAAGLGERVLLLAAGAETAALDILGVVAFRDPPRQGVPEAIAACRSAGIRVVMLTGDHPTTALAIGRTIGLIDDEAVALDGHEVETMSDRALRERLRDNSVIARVNPEQKLRIVRALEQGGEIVVVTGDGINDAPALRAADVGVAMGRNGTEVAKQSGDIVLADDNFATIVAGIEEGRSIRANIRRFISYVFTSNVAEMVPFLLYIFLPIPLPLAVIQALAIDIGTDLLPALALGVEPPTAGTMLSAPERPDRPLLSRALGVRTFLIFGATEAALGMGGFFLYYLAEGWRFGDSFTPYAGIAHEATTLTFLAIVGGQVGCLFAQRDGPLRQRLSLSSNPSIRVALVFEIGLALLLVYVPGLNQVFSMAAVHPAWLAAIPVAAAIFTGIDQVRRSVPLEEQ